VRWVDLGPNHGEAHRLDLISYQNNGKGRTMNAGQGRENVSEYSNSYIDMRADEVLISAYHAESDESAWSLGLA
jgi:hypothetical protein